MGGEEITGGIAVQVKPTHSEAGMVQLRFQAVTILRHLHGREGDGEEGQRAREVGDWCSEEQLVGWLASRTRAGQQDDGWGRASQPLGWNQQWHRRGAGT